MSKVFFLNGKGKSITRNKVVSSGYHPLGHVHSYLSDGFIKLNVEGKIHTFYISNQKFKLSMFVKNAFYIDKDVFYYSSDFTNWLPLGMATYYAVDLSDFYHPNGFRLPHKFNQDIFDNNKYAYD